MAIIIFFLLIGSSDYHFVRDTKIVFYLSLVLRNSWSCIVNIIRKLFKKKHFMVKQLLEKNKTGTKVRMSRIEVNNFTCYDELSGLVCYNLII